MASQPKSLKQLEAELQAANEAAKKLAEDLERARKYEAEKIAKAKAAAEKRAKKSAIKRKAELDTILVDYEDVVPTVVKKVSAVPSKPTQAPKPVVTAINTNSPAPKQDEKKGLLAWLNQKI